MLRVHFTDDDLARVTVATRADPLWEVLLSLHILQERTRTPTFGEWRRRTRASLPRDARLLVELAPPLGYSPDFITPGHGDTEALDQVEQVLRTPKRRLLEDITLLAGSGPGTQTMKSLAAGEPDALYRLGRALLAYHRVAIAPYQQVIQAHIDADLDLRRRAERSGGVDRLLATLHPRMVWRRPVLEIPVYAKQDLYLEGRGLFLVPSFFCRIQPITLRNSGLPPVLVYPTSPQPDWLRPPPADAPAGRDPIAALLGGTRAAVLRAVGSGGNTTDLSAMLNISAAAVSRHTSVLQDAGLIQSVRDGGSVVHHLTALGAALLNFEALE